MIRDQQIEQSKKEMQARTRQTKWRTQLQVWMKLQHAESEQ